jgi:hypothetical protein
MEVYKFEKSDLRSDLLPDDDFFEHSHGMGTNEWTLCSVAPEEWDYIKQKQVKKITCPQCLREIANCKSYKG